MSTTDNYFDLTIKRYYTFNEAIEYIKHRNKFTTNTTINWVNARTGNPVSIGCTSD